MSWELIIISWSSNALIKQIFQEQFKKLFSFHFLCLIEYWGKCHWHYTHMRYRLFLCAYMWIYADNIRICDRFFNTKMRPLKIPHIHGISSVNWKLQLECVLSICEALRPFPPSLAHCLTSLTGWITRSLTSIIICHPPPFSLFPHQLSSPSYLALSLFLHRLLSQSSAQVCRSFRSCSKDKRIIFEER